VLSVILSGLREQRIDVAGFGSFDDGTCKRVLDLLDMGELRFREVVVKRIASFEWMMEVAIVEAVLESR